MSPRRKENTSSPEHLDVLIIGAGISGIGAAYYLQRDHPKKTYALLEARDAIGGTWDLFRYPGIRSDSDIQTFGYEFKPWKGEQSIVAGEDIREYLHETVAEYRIGENIRLHHRVLSASWSSQHARWTVDLERSDSGERFQLTCGWLFCASGYYRYDQGYAPKFEGSERFQGKIIHPQHWPEDLDYQGKRVIIIGSGATAVTLVPALAESAAHVTMLQRTPTYILPLPAVDAFASLARKYLPEQVAHQLARRKNIAVQRLIWTFCQRFPDLARRIIREINVRQLPEGYPVDKHFNPPYEPWNQRLCVVPDGDLFRTIREGQASVVTDHIETFTETGIALKSGEHLDADIIVTATGLNLLPFGGVDLTVDGEKVNLPDKFVFRGMMLSGVPNFSLAIGYTNASWTLKVGLLCEYFCRLLDHMDTHGHTICRPELDDQQMQTRPLLDFDAGYIRRSIHMLPRQGDRAPWKMSMQYHSDVALLREGPVIHPNLTFETHRNHSQEEKGSSQRQAS